MQPPHHVNTKVFVLIYLVAKGKVFPQICNFQSSKMFLSWYVDTFPFDENSFSKDLPSSVEGGF